MYQVIWTGAMGFLAWFPWGMLLCLVSWYAVPRSVAGCERTSIKFDMNAAHCYTLSYCRMENVIMAVRTQHTSSLSSINSCHHVERDRVQHTPKLHIE